MRVQEIFRFRHSFKEVMHSGHHLDKLTNMLIWNFIIKNNRDRSSGTRGRVFALHVLT